jgi:hypothetical protein
MIDRRNRMREELSKKLIEDFPWIFRDTYEPKTKSAYSMRFYVEDGWYGLIRNICEELMAFHYDTGVQLTATEVKEKYGTLRFFALWDGSLLPYNESELDSIINIGFDIITKIENKSNIICEWCGNAGKTNTDGWKKTLCDSCQERRFNGF